MPGASTRRWFAWRDRGVLRGIGRRVGCAVRTAGRRCWCARHSLGAMVASQGADGFFGRSSAACFSLDPERVGLVIVTGAAGGAERFDRVGFVEPDEGIELIGQHGLEVVALQLGQRPVDDADGALEQEGGQPVAQGLALGIAPVEQGGAEAALVKLILPTVRARRADVLDVHLAIPVVGGGHLAMVGAHADQHGVVLPGNPAELTDVEFAAPAHGGGGSIADMRVVRPDHGFRRGAAVLQQGLQGLEHMPVAQVPRGRGAAVHDPVVLFGRPHHPGVLLGIEEVFVVLLEGLQAFAQQAVELGDHGILAGVAFAVFDEQAIARRLVLPARQAGIALACLLGLLRVDLIQIMQDLGHGVAQAVDIQAAKLDALVLAQLLVVVVQPVDEARYIGVAPHPGGEAGKGALGPGRGVALAGETVELRGIRPVRLDRDYVEAMPFDQALGNGGAGPVEVRGAMAGLADQHHAGIAVAVEQFGEGAAVQIRQGLGVLADECRQVGPLRGRTVGYFDRGPHGAPQLTNRSLISLVRPGSRTLARRRTCAVCVGHPGNRLPVKGNSRREGAVGPTELCWSRGGGDSRALASIKGPLSIWGDVWSKTVFGDAWLLPGLFFIVAARQKARVINMLENSLSQLEQLVSDLVQANKALQSANVQLSSELAQIKDENETLQLSAIEQEELHSATATRIQALVELATGNSTVKASPAIV